MYAQALSSPSVGLGSVEALSNLHALLKDKDGVMRFAAQEAIDKIKRKTAATPKSKRSTTLNSFNPFAVIFGIAT